ncbi:hypothetical protein ES708_22065 [subsurface metagenome]
MYEFYRENIGHLSSCIGVWDHEFLIYSKPALVAFYINELLKEQSNGEKNIDDVMYILFDDALMGQPLSKYSFLGAINSLTDFDFTNIVNDYIYEDKKEYKSQSGTWGSSPPEQISRSPPAPPYSPINP